MYYNIYEDDDDTYENLKLWSIYYIPGIYLSTLHILSHLILIAVIQDRYYYSHFTEE